MRQPMHWFVGPWCSVDRPRLEPPETPQVGRFWVEVGSKLCRSRDFRPLPDPYTPRLSLPICDSPGAHKPVHREPRCASRCTGLWAPGAQSIDLASSRPKRPGWSILGRSRDLRMRSPFPRFGPGAAQPGRSSHTRDTGQVPGPQSGAFHPENRPERPHGGGAGQASLTAAASQQRARRASAPVATSRAKCRQAGARRISAADVSRAARSTSAQPAASSPAGATKTRSTGPAPQIGGPESGTPASLALGPASSRARSE